MARFSMECSDEEFHKIIHVLEKLTNLPTSIKVQDIARSGQHEQNLDNEDEAEPEEKSLTAFTNKTERDFLQLMRQRKDAKPTSVRLPSLLKGRFHNVAVDCKRHFPDVRQPSQSDEIIGAMYYFATQYEQAKKSGNDEEVERLLEYLGLYGRLGS